MIIRTARPPTSDGSDAGPDAGEAGGGDDLSPGPGANTVEGTPSIGEAGDARW